MCVYIYIYIYLSEPFMRYGALLEDLVAGTANLLPVRGLRITCAL